MPNMNSIFSYRRALLRGYLEGSGLSCLMFLNPGEGNWDLWLPGNPALGRNSGPVLPPFNRNSLFIVSSDGSVACRSALPPHPTDPYQFPVLDFEKDSGILGSGPIGAVNLDSITKNMRDRLLDSCPSMELLDITSDMDRIRAVKSPEEIKSASLAAQVFDRAFSALPLLLRAGATEHSVAVGFRERLAELGVSAEDLNALTSLDLTSAPDGGPSVTEWPDHPGRKLSGGDRINFAANGYGLPDFACAMGRCYTLGPACRETLDLWKLAVEAEDAAAAAAKPGATIHEIRTEIDKNFIIPNHLLPDDSNFIYGLGCYRCEAPRSVDTTADMSLEAGMVLAIGPRIQLPGKDPLFCIDPYVVTDSGGKRLSGTPRVLVSL